MSKQKKSKISKIKRNNQTKTKLLKQGKLKTRRHKQPKKQVQKIIPKVNNVEEEESDNGEDLLHMVEKDDLSFLQNAISNKSYNLLKKIRLNETDINDKQGRKSKRKKEDDRLEELYEENVSKLNEGNSIKKIRMLLPIKTQQGVLEKRIIEEEEEEEKEEDKEVENNEASISEQNRKDEEQNNHEEINTYLQNNLNKENGEAVSTVELIACREEILKSRRFKIGVLSSTLLENPEHKFNNFKILLDFMEESNPEIYITVKKLSMISLLEVFKDLLPSYQILQLKPEGVKLKKETLQLHNYEAVLLKSYKQYLQKLEKMSNILRKKVGDTRIVNEREMLLGELGVMCMCELLVSHPYFNFSPNIANFLIPLLNNKKTSVREKVVKCISQVFKEDKRGELSLTIVRKINQFIKSKGHSVHPEVLSVLLSLRIKDIDLDKEKEDETKQKKLMSHKQRILSLSKRERKKSKKLEQVEKELLETKAEENKQTKQKVFTEITSVVFTIYFRILKQAPNNKILSVCLEGLAKFAHCINLDFYQDIVTVIDRLMEEGNLGLREQLHCVQCVFTILSGQGTLLNIDPYRFYVHLYKNLLNVYCGKTQDETEIILKTLIQVLINRRKRISPKRLVAFVKRMATLTLQLQHNGTLGLLCIIKQIMQLGKAVDVLLDTDYTSGDGFYQPEIEDPEYCNAHCSALWELVDLQRHYHPVVRKLAKNIAWNVPVSGEGSLSADIAKLTPEQFYTEYDPTGVAFKPPVLPPKKIIKSNSIDYYYKSNEFEEYINTIKNPKLFSDGYIDFYKIITKS
ncbi:nucleolar complex protein 3 homolog isoform X1 [Polistes fuscatus]|uniref:nucleolar complex protein 3 homolog isoform X1 n=2 Tax=Polistes fuscatus TaxID=30207 RepID=UPI001CA90330|nr:nucleolar complex protein 3 homolog isoform X1 [Polistes fuscatus]